MTSPDNAKIDTPLKTRLIDMIALKGPITVADYMTDALSHPNDGYYMSQPAIGADGDFTTAPEISQVFGELIGLWLVDTWRAMGSPDDFNLIELGPGRGVLMEDILRAARLRRGFIDAADLWWSNHPDGFGLNNNGAYAQAKSNRNGLMTSKWPRLLHL